MKWSFVAQDAVGAYHARSDMLAYLRGRADEASDVEAAALVFGELVGNVVRHAPGPIAVELYWEEGTAVLAVRDEGAGFEWAGHGELPAPFSESGRGLYIVASVSHAFSVRRLPGCGSEAVARLPVRLRTTLG